MLQRRTYKLISGTNFQQVLSGTTRKLLYPVPLAQQTRPPTSNLLCNAPLSSYTPPVKGSRVHSSPYLLVRSPYLFLLLLVRFYLILVFVYNFDALSDFICIRVWIFKSSWFLYTCLISNRRLLNTRFYTKDERLQRKCHIKIDYMDGSTEIDDFNDFFPYRASKMINPVFFSSSSQKSLLFHTIWFTIAEIRNDETTTQSVIQKIKSYPTFNDVKRLTRDSDGRIRTNIPWSSCGGMDRDTFTRLGSLPVFGPSRSNPDTIAEPSLISI